MYLIDTNIHAAYLLQNFETDMQTKRYLALYNDMQLADRIVPDFILGEFETFIIQVVPSRYRLNTDDKQKLKHLALDYINRLTNECPLVVPTIDAVRVAHDIFFDNAHTHYMSFIDCLLLATAKQLDVPLFTQDRKVRDAATKLHIPIHEPVAV
jgi:predicted nucleic acid-binding protein